jgi:DNA adenine methylase
METALLSKQREKILRWAGSKSQSEAALLPYLDFDRPYIEPFCGSATFFFSNRPKKAILNDSNHHLINFYKDVAADASGVWSMYSQIPETEESYYVVRSDFNSMDSSIQKSAYFLFLNHFCFNGIYRTNQAGKFNTPFGRHGHNKTKMKLEVLLSYAEIAKAATFKCADFEEFLLNESPQGACIFIDPPYFTDDSRVFGEYGQAVFSKSDLKRLRSVVDLLAEENQIVLTYKDCSEFKDLFNEMIIGTVNVTRNVGGFSGRRKREAEIIAVAPKK